MTTRLEADLRQALAERGSEVPAEVVERLMRIDYRPRSRAFRAPLAFGAVAAAGAAAAAIIAVVELGAGASSAFAGWSAAPTPASIAQTVKADATCRARLASIRPPSGATGTGPLKAPFSATDTRPVLTDTRGPFTVVIFAGASSTTSCISGPSFTSVSGSAGPGAVRVPAGRIMLSSVHFTTRDGHPYTIVEGHSGSGVTGTTLLLADGRAVKASTANGWFAAWWPGSHDVTGAKLATPSGTRTQHLATGGPAKCGPGPCTRAAGPASGFLTAPANGRGPESGSVSRSVSAGG